MNRNQLRKVEHIVIHSILCLMAPVWIFFLHITRKLWRPRPFWFPFTLFTLLVEEDGAIWPPINERWPLHSQLPSTSQYFIIRVWPPTHPLVHDLYLIPLPMTIIFTSIGQLISINSIHSLVVWFSENGIDFGEECSLSICSILQSWNYSSDQTAK